MTVRRFSPLLFFTVLVLGLSIYAPSGASDENRVAVVVDYGNGQVATRCVTFSEESISGYEALERTGLPVETDFQTGGAAICRIDGQGCPSEDCFCSCRGGGECKYWSYWHLIDGSWNYSAAGSGIYQVRDGTVDGWAWGPGSVTQAIPPPLLTFDEVCTTNDVNTPTITSSPTLTATPIILPTGVPATGNEALTPTPNASVSITPTQTMQSGPATTIPVVTAAATSPLSLVTSQPVLLPQATLRFGQNAQPQLAGGQDEDGITTNSTPPQPLPSTATPETTVAERSREPEIVDSSMLDTEMSELILEESEPVDGVISVGEPVTQNSASSVVGQGVSLVTVLQIPSVQEEQVDNGLSGYWGFAGLLVLLVALALFVYRRQAVSHQEEMK